MAKDYSVGIYARLSVDAGYNGQGRKNESIETQINIIKTYVKTQENMEIFDCYTDIGKTGTNFKREGFERMIEDVRQQRINCIIVKDLSRFGRNHREVGNYIEKIFPFMGVRFIALADHFDSIHSFQKEDIWGITLKNLMKNKGCSGKAFYHFSPFSSYQRGTTASFVRLLHGKVVLPESMIYCLWPGVKGNSYRRCGADARAVLFCSP